MRIRIGFLLATWLAFGLAPTIAFSDGDLPAILRGADVFVRYGVISDEPRLSAFPPVKMLCVGLRNDYRLLTYQFEFGGIFDGRPESRHSAFATFSAGLETKTLPFYLYYLPGVALITGPDAYLTTVYQFSHDIGGGIKDARGVSIDLSYRHFSNASIQLPNPGRNFLVLKLGIPFSALAGSQP